MPAAEPENGQAASLRALAALAILKVNWDERKDYIANFLPIVAHCIRQADGDVVAIADIQESVRETFEIRIPQGPLKTILGRASREGLLKREQNVYRRNDEALQELTLGPAREGVLREHAHLVQRLTEYAGTLGRTWSAEQADRALLAYVEVLAEPILGAVVEGEPVVELPKFEAEGASVVGRFVLDLAEHEPEAFGYLETIVKGSMLANVLYFPDAFSGGHPQLGRIDVYLDTPVLLRVLGYAEKHYQAPVREMAELVRGQGGSLKVFQHTVSEIEGVLDSAAAIYRTGRPGEFPGDVVDFFLSESFSASDVQAAIATLEDRLNANEIEVVARPAQTKGLAINEAELEKALNREVGYRRREALLRDLDSLTAIHRLRGGQLRRRVERCDAVFVTTNTALVRTSKAFFDAEYGRSGVPLCLPDSRLAAIAWLMNPVQAPDLPRKQIIATSYAALNPPEDVWRKYLAEIRRLTDSGELNEEQVGLLVFSPQARLELMNATDGNVDAFSEGTVQEVLDHARAAARADIQEELEREKEQRARAEAAFATERARTDEAIARAATITAAHRDRITGVAHGAARALGWAAFVFAVVVVLLGTGFATQGLFPDAWSRAVPFLAFPLIGIVVIAGLASLIFGFSLRDLVPMVERRLQSPIEQRLRGWLMPESANETESDE